MKGKTVKMVICMFPSQSKILLNAKRITIDTAFKRVKGWYEFEIEAWDDSSSSCTLRSITLRAFD